MSVERGVLAGRAAAVSLLVGFAVFALKLFAALLTGSLALLSDALESVVNVAAAAMLWAAIRISSRPADDNHPYGHAKIEYVSAGLEGALVVGAAATIAWQAVTRFGREPAQPELGTGLVVSILATAVNLALALWLRRMGRLHRSPALAADALHIRTDVYTSLAVYAGFGVAWVTGKWALDAVVALAMAAHILFAGLAAVRASLAGLMDESLAAGELEALERVLGAEGPPVLEHHGLRTRRSGWHTFVDLHLVVEGRTTVAVSHAICDRIEKRIGELLPGAQVTIHVEPEAEALGPQPP